MFDQAGRVCPLTWKRHPSSLWMWEEKHLKLYILPYIIEYYIKSNLLKVDFLCEIKIIQYGINKSEKGSIKILIKLKNFPYK